MIPVVGGSSPLGHPTSSFEAARREALERVERHARGFLESDDPEFLHQLRVGLRRLRAVLRAFRRLLDRKQARRVVHSLRKLSPKLGAARDWDVLVARLEQNAAPLEVLARAQVRRDRARERARKAVRSREFRQLLARARALEAQDTPETLAKFAAAALERAHRKLRKEKIDWADAERRHKVRIRVKRLRYTCEFFAPADPYVAALKELQEILGELNDIEVGRRLVGFEGNEKPLLRKLDAAWRRFEKRAPFW